MKETLETLKLFEKDLMSTFIINETKEKEDSMDARIASLEEK